LNYNRDYLKELASDFEDWYDNKEAKVLVIVLVPSFYQSKINHEKELKEVQK